MIKFDGGKIAETIKKKKRYAAIACALLLPLIIGAVIAATLTRGAILEGKSEYAQLSALGLAIVSLIAIIILIIFFIAPINRQLRKCVLKTLANGLLARGDLFKGGGTIEFTADYSGDILTLSRKNFAGAIALNPTWPETAESLGGAGAKIEIDLKALKAAPALYGSAGSALWLFLQGYYALHGSENGVEKVIITDNTGKSPSTLTVFDGAAPQKDGRKNYFIEKGLLK